MDTHTNATVDETAAVSGWFEVRILLCAGHSDAPHFLPGLVELYVNGVDT